MPAPKVFAASVIWTSHRDTICVLNGPEYRINVHADGRQVASLRRDVKPIPITRQMAVSGAESGPGPYRSFIRRCDVTAEQIASAVGHEGTASSVQGVVVDPDRRLWVTRSDDGIGPDRVDIINANGGYLGTFEAPGIPVAFLSSSRFVSLRLENTGQITISLYELQYTAGMLPRR